MRLTNGIIIICVMIFLVYTSYNGLM